jgi:hypothetical protein
VKQKLKNSFRRVVNIIVAVMILAPFLTSLMSSGLAHAYGLPTSRSVEMSNSTAGASGVSYLVTFTPVTSTTILGIIVDFCANDPIIGDTTCTTPAGSFGVGTPTVTGASIAGESGGSWVAGSLNSGRTLDLTDATATGTPTGSASFTITTMTNPTPSGSCPGGGTVANCTFYARIYTYASTAGATGYTVASGGTAGGAILDAGGVAISTNANIVITAKVQEQLTFCVYTGANCAAGGTTVTLGNTNGVLSTSGPFVDKNTRYDIQTNATGGAVVNVKGPTLTSGSNTIAADTSAVVSSSGTSQFGLCNYESSGSNLSYTTNTYNGNGGAAPGALCSGTSQTAGTGSTGGDNSAKFYFGAAAQGTYGDTIANDAAGSTSTGTVAFIGNVSTTQTSGIYTTTLIFIATGTY